MSSRFKVMCFIAMCLIVGLGLIADFSLVVGLVLADLGRGMSIVFGCLGFMLMLVIIGNLILTMMMSKLEGKKLGQTQVSDNKK